MQKSDVVPDYVNVTLDRIPRDADSVPGTPPDVVGQLDISMDQTVGDFVEPDRAGGGARAGNVGIRNLDAAAYRGPDNPETPRAGRLNVATDEKWGRQG